MVSFNFEGIKFRGFTTLDNFEVFIFRGFCISVMKMLFGLQVRWHLISWISPALESTKFNAP